MAIQWYPGHMHKARKEIIEALPKIDLVIEVLDARIPFSSENPVITQVRSRDGYTKPCIKVLSKTDLADPEITQLWCDHFEKEKSVKVMPISITQDKLAQRLISQTRKLFPDRADSKPIRAMIMGIPNVGKSSLINALAGRTIAKVGNEPAVTKRQQRIDIGDGIVLSDTPGILWPKVENQHSAYRLASTGAIKDTAMDYPDVAYFLLEYLFQAYPEALLTRYELSSLPRSPIEFLDAIGAKRGCLRGGGQVDLNKISTLFIHEIRGAQLGNMSFETPAMMEKELAEVEVAKAEKERLNKERKEAFKKGKRTEGKGS